MQKFCSAFAVTLTLGALLPMGAPLAAQAQDAATVSKIAMYKGAGRQKMLVDGARKEGTLVVYSTMIADQALRPLLAGFQKKYPFITAKYVRDNPPEMLQKLMAESRARHMVADVFEATGIDGLARKAGIVTPFYTPELAAYRDKYKDPDHYYAPTRFSYLGACYNTNLVKKVDLPKSFQDLLDPKWKGKLVWSSTVFGNLLFITGVRNFMGEEKAEAFLKKLAKQHPTPIAAANRVIVNRVMAGEYPMCLDAFLHHPIISARKGAPVASLPLDPVITVMSSVMLPKLSQHPHAAMLFIDYLLSKEGQTVLQKADYFPARPDVPAVPDLDKVVPTKIGLHENFMSSDKLNAFLPRSRELYQKYFTN